MKDGFAYVTSFSYKFQSLIHSLAKAAERTLPSGKLEGIGIFLFGSPSRQEMVLESDADVMIIREGDSEDYHTFREVFMKLLEEEKFGKLDVPEWGTFEDCESYLLQSITEGNQVMEARFVYGDNKVNSYIEELRKKYCTVDRFERIICFQKLYFDQYYKQRTREGVKNVKYGHGGTRDFMFVTWFVSMIDAAEGRNINVEDNIPLVYKSLSSLYERKFISFEDYRRYHESIDVVLLLRNEILVQNRRTENEGLTYLDDATLSTLFKRKLFLEDENATKEDLKASLIMHLDNVSELKQRIWDLFLQHLIQKKGICWVERFKNVLSGEITPGIVRSTVSDDELTQVAIIWYLERNKHPFFESVFEDYARSNSWIVLASICCHPQCPSHLLNAIGNGPACRKGYEYLLRIIARNKNVTNETLKSIMENERLESRYRRIAETAYRGGVAKANELR